MEDITGIQLIMNFVVFLILDLSGTLYPISLMTGKDYTSSLCWIS